MSKGNITKHKKTTRDETGEMGRHRREHQREGRGREKGGFPSVMKSKTGPMFVDAAR